jgi:branched-subunit amino acid ABC-type transport system permease component
LLTALATAVTLIFGIFDPIGFAVGAVLAVPALIAWGWPKKEKPGTHEIIEVPK